MALTLLKTISRIDTDKFIDSSLVLTDKLIVIEPTLDGIFLRNLFGYVAPIAMSSGFPVKVSSVVSLNFVKNYIQLPATPADLGLLFLPRFNIAPFKINIYKTTALDSYIPAVVPVSPPPGTLFQSFSIGYGACLYSGFLFVRRPNNSIINLGISEISEAYIFDNVLYSFVAPNIHHSFSIPNFLPVVVSQQVYKSAKVGVKIIP